MGVHGLWELLAPVGRRVSVELLSNKKLAIDASIWIIQFLKAMRDERGEAMRNAHLLGFFRRICKLLFLRVKPVFVFDGGTPFLKRRTVIARRRQREQAQSKLRKTAEKLLLNHLKAKKLEELVQEEQGKSEEKGKVKAPVESSSDISGQTSQTSQENADALLAASLAKEWEDGLQSPKELQADSDDDEQQILPTVVHGKVDPAVLAALPPSMQLKLLDEMREQLVAENRQKFQRVAKAPASFSQLQIQAYLKTVAFRRDIVQVQKAAANRNVDGVPSARIASEAGREYIFSSDSVNKRTEKLAQDVPETSSGVPETVKDVELLQKPEQGQEKDHVQTYFDDSGNKRVSRIRGMGVRMTRDLQWNLYLMKDKEAHGREDVNEAGPAEDADNSVFEKLVSEKPFEEDGNLNDESEVEWHDGPASSEKDNEDASTIETKNSIQISFVDDGSVQADDMFEKLVLESQAEEIEWEEGDRQDDAIVKTLDNSETVRKEQDIIEVSFTDDADDYIFENLVSESNAAEGIEWEDDDDNPSAGETTKQDKHNQAVRSLDGVSDEQAQLEEAIRQSLADYNRQQVHKSLNIQELGPEQRSVLQNRIEPSEAERGKGLLSGQTQGALDVTMDESFGMRVSTDKLQYVEDRTQEDQQSAHTAFKLDTARANDQQPPTEEERQTETVFATEEEERFLEAEETAARLAMIDEEREKLYQEEAELRAQQKRNERNAESVTNEMFSECQELLQLFGVPYVIAPMEAEAQCAFMDASNLVDGVITDDSDVFLFGGRSVFKNIFDGHKYVETYYMKDAEADLGLNREKLIRMAMLLGSDYTEGISGIGIVNAIEVVNAFPEEDGLEKLKEWIESPDLMIFDKLEQKSRKNKNSRKKTDSQDQLEETDPIDELDKRKQLFMQSHRAVSKNWTVPSSFPSKAVFEAYASPQVDKSTETFTWGRPDLDLLRKFCFEKFGWTTEKADELLLPVLKEFDRRETQLRLDAFYSFNHRFAKIRSTRIQKAVTGITGQRRPELMFGYTQDAEPKNRKRAAQQRRKDAPARKKEKMESGAADHSQKRITKTRRKSNGSSKVDEAKDSGHPDETRERSASLQNEAEGSVLPNEAGQRIVLPDENQVHVGGNESLEHDFEGNGEAGFASEGGVGITAEESLSEMQPCNSEIYGGGGFIVEDSTAEDEQKNDDAFQQTNEGNMEISEGGRSFAEENEPKSDPSLLAVPFFRRKRRS